MEMKNILKRISIILIISSALVLLPGCEKEKEVTPDEGDKVENKSDSSAKEFSMGKWNDNVYENEFLGLKFKLPDNWLYSSDEEIAEAMDIGIEVLSDDEELIKQVAKLTSVYYVMANNPNTGDNVLIMTEKPFMKVTTEYYLNQLKKQLSNLDGLEYKFDDVTKESVANMEFDVLTATVNNSKNELTQKYYVHKMDKYFIVIIVTDVSSEDDVKNITKYFE